MKFGCAPEERPIDDYVYKGAILLDKPPGPTSHEVVAWIRKMLKLPKAAHAGTLDPKVTGVLLILLGKSARIISAFSSLDKEYICLMSMHGDVDEDDVRKVLKEFTGKIYQKPPLRAAVERKIRTREIYEIELLEHEDRNYLLRIRCEAGTYVRKLIHDMGDALGCGAHMAQLRRIRIGNFTERECVTLHDVKDAYDLWRESGNDEMLRRVIIPVERTLSHLPRVELKDTAVDAVCHGAYIAAPGLSRWEYANKGELVAVFTSKNELVCIGRARIPLGKNIGKSGIVIKPEKVLMEPGIYPSVWK